MRNRKLLILKVLAALLLIIACTDQTCQAAIPDRYSIDLQPDTTQAVVPNQLKAGKKMINSVIVVAEFTDARQVADKKAIGWVKEIDESKVSVFPKNELPTVVIARGVKEYLKRAGYKVADKILPRDLKEGAMPKGTGKVIIGGSIEELEVTCWTGVFSNDYKINVKLNLVVADLTKGKILYRGNVSVSYSKTDTSFSEGQLGHQASLAVSDAIVKVFEGKTVAQKIKEAIAP